MTRWRFAVRAVALVYLGLLLLLTLAPVSPTADILDPQHPFVYLQPFHTIGGAFAAGLGSYRMAILLGNLTAFVPVGILVPLLWPEARRPWIAVVAAGIGLSVAIEAAQLGGSLIVGYAYRQADIDDVIANTFGACLGYAVLRATARVHRGAKAAPSR